MEIRFGYVAMSVVLQNASPSKTVTVKNYSRLVDIDPELALNKVRRVSAENLEHTLRILRYNAEHEVDVYRFSSKLVPLATHPLLSRWDYIEDLKREFEAVGCYVKDMGMRVSFHPDHYTLINTPREDVFEASILDLQHHCSVLEAMGLDEKCKLVIHVGGGYKDKKAALERFCSNIRRVPQKIVQRLTLENDDKIYTAVEVLELCQKLSLPLVLDLHHHHCNNNGENLEDIIDDVFATWEGTGLPPKIHISSPKSECAPRHHHDFINPEDLYPFLILARDHCEHLDVMVEAKQKDKAVFQLVSELSNCPLIKQKGKTTLVI